MTKVMKTVLLVLLLSLGLIPVFAQKSLPPSLRPYAPYLSHTIVKSLNQLGYDMPTMVAQSAISTTNNRSAEFRLDSSITFYNYYIEEDSLPIFRSLYTYPQTGTEVEANFQHENQAWFPLDRIATFRDGQQRILENYAEVYDPSSAAFVPDSRLIVYRHGSSADLIDSFFVYFWNPDLTTWAISFYNLNKFDQEDRLLETISTFDYFGQPLLFRDVYAYDQDGDNFQIDSYVIIDGEESYIGHSSSKFLNHQVIETRVFGLDEFEEEAPVSRTTYTYTWFGKEEQVNEYEWDHEKADWYQNQQIIYSYDMAQRVSQKDISHYYPGLPEERALFIYDYFEDEKLALETTYDWYEDYGYLLSSRKFFYYSGLSQVHVPVSAMALSVSPNPGIDHILLELNGNAQVQLFDVQGNLLRNLEYHPGQILNISDLPGGLYWISARKGHEIYTGKVIKL